MLMGDMVSERHYGSGLMMIVAAVVVVVFQKVTQQGDQLDEQSGVRIQENNGDLFQVVREKPFLISDDI